MRTARRAGRLAVSVVLLVGLGAGCGSASSPSTSRGATLPPTTTTGDQGAAARHSCHRYGGSAGALIEQARRDAARRTGTRRCEWTLSRLRSVTWPDTSLGCPKPGFAYAQHLTPGYVIDIRRRSRTREYHAGAGTIVSCARAAAG